MTLFEELQAQIGSLIHVKTQLFFEKTVGWDGIPERFCVLLDVAKPEWPPRKVYAEGPSITWVRADRNDSIDVQLLLDGTPQWIALNKENFEIVK